MSKLGKKLIAAVAQRDIALMYDPPSGWRYGFPRPYKPLEGETLGDTLLRDGYPQKELDSITVDGSVKWVRFFGGGDG